MLQRRSRKGLDCSSPAPLRGVDYIMVTNLSGSRGLRMFPGKVSIRGPYVSRLDYRHNYYGKVERQHGATPFYAWRERKNLRYAY
jgi:hypothetical protein